AIANSVPAPSKSIPIHTKRHSPHKCLRTPRSIRPLFIRLPATAGTAGIDPGPQRGKGSWDEFLRIHADTLWQCNFLSKPMWTAKGLVDVYLLVFLHLGSRRVWISPSTVQPDSAWVSLQARNLLMVAEDMGLTPKYVMRDNDAKFSGQFDEVFKTSGVQIKRTVPMSPKLRADVERFIETLKFEYLNKFIIVAEKHLDYICRIWSRHSDEERPHSSRDHVPSTFTAPPYEATSIRINDIVYPDCNSLSHSPPKSHIDSLDAAQNH
ncbi:MAG: integrase core domain-containing protein, partial [Planctomycetales bacterium]|nr:integrase core domain-containing protein [Planctomycetales bacterium]